MAPWVLPLSLLGCGGGDGPLDDQTITTESFQIEYSTVPEAAQVGENMVMLVISDKGGDPALGLEVAVEPWMAAHGHGTEGVPTVHEMDGGHYHVSDLVFQMPGTWTMNVELTAGDLVEAFSFEIDVE